MRLLSVSPLATSSHSVNRHMARSRTPRPAQTESSQDYDHQQDPRSAPEWPPRGAYDQLNQPLIEAHCELDDEILMRTLSQVRSGGNDNDRLIVELVNTLVSSRLETVGGG